MVARVANRFISLYPEARLDRFWPLAQVSVCRERIDASRRQLSVVRADASTRMMMEEEIGWCLELFDGNDREATRLLMAVVYAAALSWRPVLLYFSISVVNHGWKWHGLICAEATECRKLACKHHC